MAVALTASGCGGDPVSMPDVTEQRLDVALSDIERAGFEDEVEVVGGGVFGVVDESNWTVCVQEPASGSEVGSAPRLTVERDCAEASEGSQDAEGGADQDDAEAEESPKADRSPGRQRQKGARKKRRPVTFTMPALVGLNLQLGQDVLQAEGSYLLTQTDALGLDRFQVLDSGWKICSQEPGPGTTTSTDTLVDLGVVKLNEACP